MKGFILDASALLAMLQNEPGSARVVGVLDKCAMHTVNMAEVIARLMRSGVPLTDAESMVYGLHLEAEPRLDDPGRCGHLLATQNKLGLSLGDCVCLTTAALSKAIAVTADHRWKELDGIDLQGMRLRVEVIR